MGEWADGIITVHRPFAELKEVVDAFRKNGGEGKPIYLKVQLSFARSEEEALQGAWDQWRTNIFHSTVLGDLWQGREPEWEKVLRYPNVKLHLYGKFEARPGRKMGHYTVLDETAEAALRLSLEIKQSLNERP